MNAGFAPYSYCQPHCIPQICDQNINYNKVILVPGPTFYLRGSSNLYMIPLEKALPIMRSRGFDRPFPPLPLCERCLSDCATKVNGLFGNVCDACYDKEMRSIWRKEKAKRERIQNKRVERNYRLCSTCSIRRACIKNGRKYKTCEECLLKKRDERLKRISEERKKQNSNENNTNEDRILKMRYFEGMKKELDAISSAD